mgnify:CR=1 FL=1
MLTVALTLGVLVSLAFTEAIGLSAGGIVSPGYVALLLDRPAALLTLLALALATFGAVRLLGDRLLLFGTRRYALALLIGLAASTGAQFARGAVDPAIFEWAGIGYIVPGLIAHQFDRQGVLPTLLVLAIAAPLVRVLTLLVMRWM